MERISTDDNRHSMLDNLNIFDDEFAVEDFDVVADGFAPGRVQNDRRRTSHVDSDEDGDDDDDDDDDDDNINNKNGEAHVRSVSAYMVENPLTPSNALPRAGPSRNSIRKSREAQREAMNPFRSAEDDAAAGSALDRTSSMQSQSTIAFAPGINRRSISSISSQAYARAQSPSQGASGPSHPYAMYPQDTTLGRTASVSTTSTVRAPHRPLLAQQGPAHPYSMYPQNVADDAELDEDDDTTQPRTHIPVGFPGRAPGFRRRQGPEGEEQDIIGVDGHTEQLPPYSEYPEDGTPKPIVIAASTPTPQSSTQLHVPLMLQQTLQRPQSMSDAGAQSAGHGFSSMEQMDSNDSVDSSTKSWKEKTWKEKRKTKFCGIPFWWILLSGCVLAFVAIVLGATIGAFLGSQKKNTNGHGFHHPPRPSSFFDASPLPTPTGNPPVTGTYALSVGTAEATQSACLVNQNYSQAWGCDMPSPPDMAINIGYQPAGSSGPEGAYLFSASDNTTISYGTQVPETEFSPFLSVQDNDDPSRGPAFYFQAFYDKLVIVPASALPPSSGSQKRDAEFYIDPQWQTRRQVAAIGDQPWYCYWNGTFLEGFIYVNNYTGSAGSQSAATYATSTASPTGSHSPSSASPYMPSTTTRGSSGGPSQVSTPLSSTATYPPLSSTTPAAARRFMERQASTTNYGQLAPFGYVVKIEERRIQDSPSPYCVKMQILNDGTANVVPDANGNPITINLSESDPGYSAYQSAGLTRKRTDTVAGGCHCQWWSGV
ncbi:hypothetical protein MBLNU459_g2085t2 [Dothideomycetes sp. NU459]